MKSLQLLIFLWNCDAIPSLDKHTCFIWEGETDAIKDPW